MYPSLLPRILLPVPHPSLTPALQCRRQQGKRVNSDMFLLLLYFIAWRKGFAWNKVKLKVLTRFRHPFSFAWMCYANLRSYNLGICKKYGNRHPAVGSRCNSEILFAHHVCQTHQFLIASGISCLSFTCFYSLLGYRNIHPLILLPFVILLFTFFFVSFVYCWHMHRHV